MAEKKKKTLPPDYKMATAKRRKKKHKKGDKKDLPAFMGKGPKNAQGKNPSFYK